MHIFISYSNEDRDEAKKLVSELKAAGQPAWLADQEVLPGENWSLKTGKALEQSNAMVILLSPAAMQSKHVHGEISYALGSTQFEGRVIPIVLKPTPDIPWILRKFQVISARGQSMKSIAKKVVAALAESSKIEMAGAY